MKHLVRRALCFLLIAAMVSVPVAALGGDDPLTGRFERSQQKSAVASQAEITHDERFQTGYEIERMIDVSQHNGLVNWSSVAAAGIKYAMIRVGFCGYGTGSLNADSMFSTNVRNAQAAGIRVGVYFYSQAITPAEAAEEADFVLARLSGIDLQLPVAFDCEYAEESGRYAGRLYDANLSKAAVSQLCLAFCDRITAGGFSAMVYANAFMLSDKMNASTVSARYPIWIAAYRTAANYSGDYIMWQFSNKERVSGISTNVDMSYYYIKKDAPSAPVYLALTTSALTLQTGEYAYLTAHRDAEALAALGGTVSGVQYTSSDPAVLYVDSSAVAIAQSAGTATITATVTVTVPTEDPAAPTVTTFTDSVTITVTEPPAVPEPDPEPEPGEDSPGIFTLLIQLFSYFVKMVAALFALLSGGAA